MQNSQAFGNYGPHLTGWLEDAAYFAAIDDSLNAFSWYDWPEPLKNRHLAALEEIYQTRKDFVWSILTFQCFPALCFV